ncbi:MAG TPA: AAA family ATPase [Candidatus Paceibacterota bacterium]
MRITILGLPGSGKSTLARNIAERLHIPHIHIDRFWVEAGGGHNVRTTQDPKRTHEHVRTKVLEAIQGESWVSDGVYGLIQPEIARRAEAIVFLDTPFWRRLINHALRTVRRKHRRDEMTFWGDVEFFRELVAREMRDKSKIMKFVETYPAKSVVLKNRKEVRRYLAGIARDGSIQ